jgi:hypothetical protein
LCPIKIVIKEVVKIFSERSLFPAIAAPAREQYGEAVTVATNLSHSNRSVRFEKGMTSQVIKPMRAIYAAARFTGAT